MKRYWVFYSARRNRRGADNTFPSSQLPAPQQQKLPEHEYQSEEEVRPGQVIQLPSKTVWQQGDLITSENNSESSTSSSQNSQYIMAFHIP